MLEKLKDDNFAGMPIVIMDELREKFPEKFNESGQMDWEWFEKEIRPNYFVYVRKDKNSLSFTMSNGDTGCSTKHVVAAALSLVRSSRLPEDAEEQAKKDEIISHLATAYQLLDKLLIKTGEIL